MIERWLIGGLRLRVFHSLAELNVAIGEMLRISRGGRSAGPA